MSGRFGKAAVLAVAGVLVAGVLVAAGLIVAGVAVGRVTADRTGGRAAGYSAGHADGYVAGLQRGEAQGRQEGRALQEGTELPPGSRRPAQDGFNAGYVAGANDAFGGYDGGWALAAPYVVTVEPGTGQITYRVATRTTIEPGIDYFLCPDGHSICTAPRH